MDLSLVVLQGKPQGKELPIRVSPFIIGRGPECHLRPNSDMVSRLHCALTIHGQEAIIRDLGSTNGTIVDGERLTEAMTLSDGDIFQVGPLVFQVVIRHVGATEHPAADPTAKPAAAASTKPVASETADADEIVQWLVSDTKNEIPASGSGVFTGKTVFTTSPAEKAMTSGAEPVGATPDRAEPGAQAGAREPAGKKPTEQKQKTPWTPGGAAHAAEDMLRHFLERRPHSPHK